MRWRPARHAVGRAGAAWQDAADAGEGEGRSGSVEATVTIEQRRAGAPGNPQSLEDFQRLLCPLLQHFVVTEQPPPAA